jgi:hypothetical protein
MLQAFLNRKSEHKIYVQYFSENRALYEIMWKNMVHPDRPQTKNIIRLMRFACWIPRAIEILRICRNN